MKRLCKCGCGQKTSGKKYHGKLVEYIQNHHHGKGFKKGCKPWNKGLVGYKNNGSFKNNKLAKNWNGFKKENIPWNKGIGWKAKSSFKKGQHASPSTEFKSGKSHPSWSGGITPQATKLRNKYSKKINEWRLLVFERDDYTCQLCGKRGGNLNADHIKPFSFYPKSRFDVNNGRTLCVPCHRKTKTYGWRVWGLDSKIKPKEERYCRV